MYRQSLRRRVAIAFALCVTILSLLWGFAFFGAIRLSEDRVVVNQLQLAAESYPYLTTSIRGYENIESLPEILRQWAQNNPIEGLYEFESAELHVAVIAADNELGRAFVVFDVAGIEAASSEDWWWLLLITGVVGTLGALGFGLGMLVMRRAIAPVEKLANVVANIDLEHLSTGDHKRVESGRFGDDEVGVLAKTIENTLERIGGFIVRERYFTSSASHELRTPITVILGALELLEHNELSDADRVLVNRVKRATLDMQTTIEMFLCLSRETNDTEHQEMFELVPLVNQAIDNQHHLLHGKCVEINIDELAEPTIFGYRQAFSVVVNNLIRNACEHTLDEQGPISIVIDENELSVSNSLNHDEHDDEISTSRRSVSNGYGLGLGIVQRLCERNDWSFSLHVNGNRLNACVSW